MNGDSSSTRENVAALSAEKRRLLEALIEKQARHSGEIRPCPRQTVRGRTLATTSWAQRRLWLLDQLEGAGVAYNLALTVRIYGALEESILRRALDALVARHEILRTVFSDLDGDPQQHVLATGQLPLHAVDLSGVPAPQREDQLRTIATQDALERFDLCAGPLVRGRLLRLQSDEHVLLITMHHIVCDGWSLGILARELTELYAAFLSGRADPLPPLAIQYADYAQWQRQSMSDAVAEQLLGFWRTSLAGAPQELELPTDLPRPAVARYRGASVDLVLDPDLTGELKALAARHGLTLFMVLYAAWAILLSRLCGQEDLVIGVPVANRPRPELEPLIGFFVNMLALRVQVSGERSVTDLLQHVKQCTLDALDHQDMPFERIVEALRPPRVLNRHPIFQAMFALQNAPQGAWQLPGSRVEVEDNVIETSKLDLLLSLQEQDDGIAGIINYDSDLFQRQTIERWVGCLIVVLRAMARKEHGCVAELSLLSEAERRQVVERFNATSAPYPQHEPVHRLFEAQVERTPDAIAVICEGRSLTYRQLNARANRLAHYLEEHGLLCGEYVPVLMSRSLAMLVAQLALLKRGGVYVPVDPDLPAQRRSFIVRDTGARLILHDGAKSGEITEQHLRVIDCTAAAADIAMRSNANLDTPAVTVTPAYVMYTSGSTGIPKGVVVPHAAVNRLVINNGYARVVADDCIPHYSNPAFDASTFEVWGALLNGARLLIVPPAEVLDAQRFTQLLLQHRVSVLWMTVGLFNQYTQALAEVFRRLRYLLIGGDVLEPQAVARVLRDSPPQHLLNAYGPTECTTFSTTFPITKLEACTRSVPIGRPIANTRIYVLDHWRQPVPIGVTGELYIGGAGVACGYLNRPELTADRFVPDAFTADPQARLYRTGDLGRWRADGNIDFLGRNDQQIKIRGFRIELGEIETQLARHAQVDEALVVAREDSSSDKRLAAYLVAREPTAASELPAPDELRSFLRSTLPDYMVPSAFVWLEKLPLSSSGKVDRRALPEPGAAAYANREYEPPQGEVELGLAQLWQDLLQVARVGRSDNFFDLGGHSLLAVQMLFRINQTSGTTLRVTDIYVNPTLRQLAARVAGAAVADEPVDLTAEAALGHDIIAQPGRCRAPARAILVTGATGFVGRFLLTRLLLETDAIIYCVTRARPPQYAQRLRATLTHWDLWRDAFESRIVSIPGNLRLPRLGVEDRIYADLANEVDSIYHCATSMNHLETYAMAKPMNVAGALEVLRLAVCRRPKLVNYVSTLSVFSDGGTGRRRVVHEASPIEQESHSAAHGYVASKWVGEKIFKTAAERGIACNIFRLGLIWADARGRYDELQRDYRIIKSCLLSGVGIANFRPAMPPTPVDYAARAIVALAQRHADGGRTFHISSPEQTIGGLFECCNDLADTALQLVPWYEWICEMRRLHHAGRSLPVVPLIEFAFSMDKESFNEYQLRASAGRTSFDCSRTHRELEAAGIVASVLDDRLLAACLDSMLSRDEEVREALVNARPAMRQCAPIAKIFAQPAGRTP